MTLALGAPAKTVATAGESGLPRIRREPPIQIASTFSTVGDCSSVITLLDLGQFQLAAWMIEQMLWNSRVRATLATRFDGLVGTEISWEPGRNNAVARRAARDIVEDWPLIVSAATRKQIGRWGLMLGVGIAQKHWYESPWSGRRIPRLEAFHPQWAMWDWATRAYRIWTLDGWATVPSPALMVPGEEWKPASTFVASDKADTLERWVIHEPFGQHSWRDGYVHAAWRPWLGHEFANRDMSRGSEKVGLGIIKLKYPRSLDQTALNTLMGGLRTLGSEGVIPLEQSADGDPLASYDAEPFEWQATGADIIRGTKESNASDLAVLFLGHNTTTETKGASVGASAQVGNLIRGDIRVGDTLNELTTLYTQVLRPWAEENYGDASAAPIPIYVTDPPGENQAAAQTCFMVTQAIEKLKAIAPGVDFDVLLTRFRIPLKPGGGMVESTPIVSAGPKLPGSPPGPAAAAPPPPSAPPPPESPPEKS